MQIMKTQNKYFTADVTRGSSALQAEEQCSIDLGAMPLDLEIQPFRLISMAFRPWRTIPLQQICASPCSPKRLKGPTPITGGSCPLAEKASTTDQLRSHKAHHVPPQ